jgi:hypothetical protein
MLGYMPPVPLPKKSSNRKKGPTAGTKDDSLPDAGEGGNDEISMELVGHF